MKTYFVEFMILPKKNVVYNGPNKWAIFVKAENKRAATKLARIKFEQVPYSHLVTIKKE